MSSGTGDSPSPAVAGGRRRSGGRQSGEQRSPGEVLAAARAEDSRRKRARVLAALEELKASGEKISAQAVARRAGVSRMLVYSQGVREHVEAAIAGQARAADKSQRRAEKLGARADGASAASLACDLQLAREEIRQLRAERDKLKATVQRGLGAALEHAGTAELTARINELLAQVERLAVERDATAAHNAQLQARLTDAENNLTANRQALKKMIKSANLEG
ncbi:DUF6262 family protein [Actinomadura sp. NPDC049753]|uniref:DUF6262 family protein n=1 Tax=Actinomadura sp. NPDC049753 TaxID=3154739 RepID=UPI003412A929